MPLFKGMTTEEVLETLADIRRRMPKAQNPKPKKKRDESERTMNAVGETEEDFERAAVIDALEDITEELGEMLAEKRAKMVEQALDVYYTAEELSKDPAHPELLEHVENMRKAYENQFGKPIPPRPADWKMKNPPKKDGEGEPEGEPEGGESEPN